MKHRNTKSADDVIVPDGESGIQKMRDAIRRIIGVPKAAMPATPKKRSGHKKK